MTRFFALTSLVIAIISCSPGKSSNPSKMKILSLTISSNQKQYSLDETIIIQVSLKNQSKDSILINDRFLCGYENDEDRELFFQIFDSNGARFDTPENSQTDIFSVPVRKENLRMLAPDEKIEQTVNFSMIHQLKKGEYQIVGKYISPPHNKTKTSAQDTITSKPMRIVIN